MLVLGVDPGTRQLGLSLVDTTAGEVLRTTCIDTGKDNTVRQRLLRVQLEDFLAGALPELVATETPPHGFAGSKNGGATACGLWYILGGIAYWAAEMRVPISMISPANLKLYACRTIDIPYQDWEGKSGSRSKKKWGIKQAVARLTGTENPTDHEADAVLAAFALAS